MKDNCCGMDGFTFEKAGELVRPFQQNLFRFKGGKCLSQIYLGIRTKFDWECSEGHRFKFTAHRVRNQNGWCTICNKRDKLNKRLQLRKEITNSRDGKLISDIYIFGRREKLLWECEAGHQFLVLSHHVISGMKSQCPT